MTRRLSAWLLRQALGPYRAETVLGDLDEELARRASGADGLRLLWRAATFVVAVRWSERRRPVAMAGSLAQDLRYAVRAVWRRPGRFVAAAAMLALAVGITTAMFTVVDALLLRPVPFADADRIVQLRIASERGVTQAFTREVFDAWRDLPAIEAAEATFAQTDVPVSGLDSEAIRHVALVTPGTFDLLGGVQPLLGRLFSATEGAPGSNDAVLISEDVWRELAGSDPGIIGRQVLIGESPATIVGVLPSEFRFPRWYSSIWKATQFVPGAPADGLRPTVYARLASDVPVADVEGLATRAAHAAGVPEDHAARTSPLASDNLDDLDKRSIRLLAGGVALLFVILCSNVSSLLLTGITARQHELATRTALGAPRRRLIGQAMLEAGLVGVAGVASGLALAATLVSVSRAALVDAVLLHSLNPLNLDARALVASSVLGFIATVVAGALPSLLGTRVDGRPWSGGASRSGTESRRVRLASRALLVGQIALSCTLLVSGTVLVRSFMALAGTDRGLDVSNVAVTSVSFRDPSIATADHRLAAAEAVVERVRALPGVTASAWAYGFPPGGGATIVGRLTADVPDAASVDLTAHQYVVENAFFDFYDIAITRGRAFDTADPPGAVVLSERLARLLSPDADLVGRSVEMELDYGTGQLDVIGIAEDIFFPSLDRSEDHPQFYVQQRDPSLPMLHVRCDGRCPSTASLRRAVVEAYPAVDVQGFWHPERLYFEELARPRAAAALAFGFAATALVAAGAGLFSLLSYAVARRRREFGIRSALGASAASLRALVWRDAFVVVASGVAIGVLGGVSLTRIMSALLYDVTMADPMNWVIVGSTITLAVTAAAWRPARTAVRADPLLLMREE